jgi:hypothetical protein
MKNHQQASRFGEDEMKQQRRQLFSGDVGVGSEARHSVTKDGLRQARSSGKYVPSRNALS